MIAFMLLRILDVLSTLLAVDAFGIEVETNPVSRFWLERELFIQWQIVFTLMFCILFPRFSKSMRMGVHLFNVVTLLVVVSNFLSYVVAKGLI